MADPKPELFELGPPQRIQRRFVLVAQGRPHVIRRATFAVLVGWLPLLILTAAGPAFSSFVSDMGVLTRSLIATPLLILAEITCARYLTAIADHFVDANYIATQDVPAYRALRASINRWLTFSLIEIAVVILAYILVFFVITNVPRAAFPAWQLSETGINGFSVAGWWNILVSAPLLIMALLGWLWRWCLWVRFLIATSRLKLKLVPSHPDHMAGLGFIGHSLRAYSTVALALSTIVAGRVANEVLLGISPFAHKYLLIGTAIAVIAFFTLPLFAFTRVLLHEWHRGMASYGELASYLGRDFEAKWFDRTTRSEIDGLGAADFSALTDLYQIVSNTYAMRLSPVNLQNILVLVGALLLPFGPVVAMIVPADIILKDLAALLL